MEKEQFEDRSKIIILSHMWKRVSVWAAWSKEHVHFWSRKHRMSRKCEGQSAKPSEHARDTYSVQIAQLAFEQMKQKKTCKNEKSEEKKMFKKLSRII